MTMYRGLVAALGLFVLLPAASAETLLERGAYLMNGPVACGNCHTPMGPDGPVAGMELAGGTLFEDQPFTAHAPNITPDPETGIGGWTDDQIVAAIREGRRPDGSIIGPPMPIELYSDISDRDLRAIVAYLRQANPVRNQVAKWVYRIPLPPAYGPPVASVAEVPLADPVAYGAYIAGPLAHCTECHTPMDATGRRVWSKTGAGGAPILGPWGAALPPNLTPHREDGLGAWTDEEIVRAVTRGIGRDGQRLSPPMGYGFYANLTGDDLAALVAYLRSLPAFPDAH